MSELSKIIRERRSVRKFTDKLPAKELISAVIEDGLFAASGRGRQAPIVIAVTNRELRDKISEENRKIGGWDEGFDPFYGAPVILVVATPAEISTSVYDGSLVLGNMMLKACELGLGSCWIHRAKEEFESPFGRELLDSIGLKGDYIGVGHLALGYSADPTPDVIPRKDGRVFFIE